MSLATLLDGSGSLMPGGTVAVTVLVNVPADVPACSDTVNVTDPAAARSTVVLIAPVPDAAAHDDPAAAEHVHETVVTPVGSGSSMSDTGGGRGPGVGDRDGVRGCGARRLRRRRRWTSRPTHRRPGSSVSLSDAVLLAPLGSVTPTRRCDDRGVDQRADRTRRHGSGDVHDDARTDGEVDAQRHVAAARCRTARRPGPGRAGPRGTGDGRRDRIRHARAGDGRRSVVDDGDVVAHRVAWGQRRDVVGLGHGEVGDLFDVGQIGRRVVGRVGVDDADRCSRGRGVRQRASGGRRNRRRHGERRRARRPACRRVG